MAQLINLKTHADARGNLTVLEALKDIPFEIKRVFYIYNVQSEQDRGGHRHKKTIQVLISVKGSCEIFVDNNITQKKYRLASPDQCLLINPDDWHTMSNFSNDAVLLVLASEYYDPNDYIYAKY